MSAPREMGPIDYLVVEFPDGSRTGEGLPLLVDLVDRGLIRILDLLFVRKEIDGSVDTVEIGELAAGADLAVFRGATSGLLDRDDVAEAGTVLAPGVTAAILVYENVWAAPLASALRRGGAQLVAGGRIPVDAVVGALAAAGAPAGSS